MQSLYKIIKNTSVIKQGKTKIHTDYTPPVEEEVEVIREVNAKEFINSYENLARTMLESSRKKSDDIIAKAFQEAEKIQLEAYPKAYDKGYKEGKEKGYKDAYEEAYVKNMEKLEEEKTKIIENTREEISTMMKNAREEYLNYLQDKKDEIKDTIENIVENVFQREIKDGDSLNSMILNVLDDVKNSKTIIIRCNGIYLEDIKCGIDSWRQNTVFKGEIFVISDEFIEEGSAVIEKDNGKIVVSSSRALEKVKQIIEDSE
ncbi:hypothetical protein [Clostridium rectalis]|uniref:FliH/SctL family protein n=1 Tax=Clostridium rectalis TaxID=2040295 RepID=UPI001FAAAC6A|nr:hypothetical protein [Clostridium rectalis]